MSSRVALITGGAGHIGRATAIKLAKRGVGVAIIDKDEEASTAFADDLRKNYAVDAAWLSVDLMAKDQLLSVLGRVKERFGRLDFLVNNAAFYDDAPGWGVPFEEEGYEAWEKVMKVNLLAPFFLAQQLAPLMRESDLAAVVNVSSIYGVVGPDHGLYEGLNMTNPAAYAASKGGLVQLTRWLSTVLAPAIRVNTVTPGGIERGQNEVFIERYNRKTPLGRMASNEDIAGAIAYLLSDEAAYVTGQNLVVDGGWTTW